jgi:hypothetical protein
VSRTGRGPALVAAVLGLLLGLVGCVSVPTSGPVEKVEGQQPACQSCVNVEVAPPAPGDDPQEVVEGFLRANANFQPNYSVARQFLTRAQADSWTPKQTWIYTGRASGAGSAVLLTGEVVGLLDEDRTFLTDNRDLKLPFRLVQEDGQWRIANPPPVLLVTKFSFDSFYARYDLFFVGSNDTLVPDTIYLPDLRAPANIASALVRELLDGPSAWLEPAVRTAVPANTSLAVDSVTLNDGTAVVPLRATVQQLPNQERSLLAAQLVYTLKQVIGVKKVLLEVDSLPFGVPESEPNGLAVPVEGTFRDLDPVPFVTAEQLYAVRGRSVVEAGANTDAVDPQPLAGLGSDQYDVQALAVSVTDTDLAIVTDGGTVLRRTPTSQIDVTTVLDGVTGLLRPQFSRSDELWAVGTRGGRQRMWVTTATGTEQVRAPVLGKGRVTAFRISPDGARMALVVRQGAETHLAMARIVRTDGVTVDGWRVLDTSTGLNTSAIEAVRDVAWSDADTLVVLGAVSGTSPYVPSTVTDDAAEIETEPRGTDWDARSVSVLLRTGSAVVVTGDGRAFRDDGTQWREVLDRVTAVAFPG